MSAQPWQTRLDTIPLRLPPQNIEAEICTLGSMLLDNTKIDEVAALVRPSDFFREAHGSLFRKIVEVHGSGSPVDGLILSEHLARAGDLERIGGDEVIWKLLEDTPHAANAEFYARIVRQKAVARGLIEQSETTVRECYSNLFTADQLVEQAEVRVFAVGEAEATGDTVDVAEAVDEANALIDRRIGGEVTGVSSGLLDLDDALGGFQPGTLTIIAARPSMGKTALALNIADHAAVNCGVVPLFVSLEMGRAELALRMIQSRAEVDGYRLRNAHLLTGEERGRLHLASMALREKSFPIDESPARSVAQIAANARRLKARRGIGLLVVDYLQLVEGQGASRQEQVASISRRLKQLSKELDLPVIALSQVNRSAEGREDHRPRMADLRESGAIEQDADVVILLHRPDYYDPDDEPGTAEAIVAKNRNGAVGTVGLVFRRHLARFENLSRGQEPA